MAELVPPHLQLLVPAAPVEVGSQFLCDEAFPINLSLDFSSSGRQKKLLPGGDQAGSLFLLALINAC